MKGKEERMKDSKQPICLLLFCIFFLVSIPVSASSLPIKNGFYLIATDCSTTEKALTVHAGSVKNGANIEIYNTERSARENDLDQMFKVVFVKKSGSAAWYSICSAKSGKALTAVSGSGKNTANCVQQKYIGADGQLWQFRSSVNGCYYIQSKSGLYLENSGGKTNDGNNVLLTSFNKKKRQRWKFRELTDLLSFSMKRFTIYSDSNDRKGTTLKLYVKRSNGRTNQIKATKWKSSNPSVVSVSADGIIKGIKPGKAVLKATYYNVSTTVDLTVKYPLRISPNKYGVDFKNNILTLEDENPLLLTADLYEHLVDTTKWKSSDPSVVTVTSDYDGIGGYVVAKNPGTATITAYVRGLSTSIEVIVPERYVDLNEYRSKQNVLVLNFDPVFSMAGGKKWHELMNWWHDPHDLAKRYSVAMNEVSHGCISYTIAEWIDIDEMPEDIHGKSHSLSYYYETITKADASPEAPYWDARFWNEYDAFDYDKYLTRYDVYNKVRSGKVDEVWIFGGPCVGVQMNETIMVGKNAFWCNGAPIQKNCKPFVVYCFNDERDIDCMMHDAGHRAEHILSNVYGWADYSKNYDDYTDWEKFSAYDKVAPGNSGVGLVHFAPNSITDYQWNNSTYVDSYCNDWDNYPDMKGKKDTVNYTTWGNGNEERYLRWWFGKLPHVSRYDRRTGKYMNWWIYFTLDHINNPPYKR